jgi:hypothetical protein
LDDVSDLMMDDVLASQEWDLVMDDVSLDLAMADSLADVVWVG